jgi:biopolymer transport protein ExbD
MRVQRTRSSASPPHSPLTRRPLGARITSVLVVALLLAGACRMPEKQPKLPKGPVAKVHVQADGVILLNGQQVTLEDLKKKFAELKSQDGVVWYSRANAQGEPPSSAMEVMRAIVDARLPVRLLEKPE